MIGDYNINQEPAKVVKRVNRKPLFENDPKRIVTVKGRHIFLPPDEIIERFKAAYQNTKNEDLQNITGHDKTWNYCLAVYLGLKKSAEYMRQTQLNASAKGNTPYANEKRRRSILNRPLNEGFIKHQFKKGHLPWNDNRKGEEVVKAIKERILKTRNETIKAERRRIAWGLQQQTRLKLVRQPKQKVSKRYSLKKFGYTEVEKNIFIAPKEVRKLHVKIERNAAKYFKFYSSEEYQLKQA